MTDLFLTVCTTVSSNAAPFLATFLLAYDLGQEALGMIGHLDILAINPLQVEQFMVDSEFVVAGYHITQGTITASEAELVAFCEHYKGWSSEDFVWLYHEYMPEANTAVRYIQNITPEESENLLSQLDRREMITHSETTNHTYIYKLFLFVITCFFL